MTKALYTLADISNEQKVAAKKRPNVRFSSKPRKGGTTPNRALTGRKSTPIKEHAGAFMAVDVDGGYK